MVVEDIIRKQVLKERKNLVKLVTGKDVVRFPIAAGQFNTACPYPARQKFQKQSRN